MHNSMTRPGSQPGATRPLVAREDDPLFDADHSRCSGPLRRASITVADVEEIARRADEAAGVRA
ncbi:hypothetical protein QFZ76_010276 [Streptomyces sp. V4I2]|nr:hypothetical protein [Streptomyces sp. V4I2]